MTRAHGLDHGRLVTIAPLAADRPGGAPDPLPVLQLRLFCEACAGNHLFTPENVERIVYGMQVMPALPRTPQNPPLCLRSVLTSAWLDYNDDLRAMLAKRALVADV